jgi:hypothetical protein
MEQISFNLARYTQPQKKEPKYYWQRIAMDAIEYLDNPFKSQVFMYAKKKESKLQASLSYMKQRNIKSFLYLAKMMSL